MMYKANVGGRRKKKRRRRRRKRMKRRSEKIIDIDRKDEGGITRR